MRIGPRISMAALALLGSGVSMARMSDPTKPFMPYIPRQPPERVKPTKCLLKDCTALTTHNGGYCSAKHCKLDRERRKVK